MANRGDVLAKGFIQELDGLRGIAILMVMVHRFWPRTGVGVAADVAGAGWIGVDLFFVVSGFLIAGILLDTKGDPGYFRNFYARRALRILPLYYLFVIGVFVAFAHNAEFLARAGSPFWYLVHLGNVPEGLLGLNTPYWIAPVWSLAIEEQFYLTFPWLVNWVTRRRLTIVLVSMIVIAPVIRLITMFAFPDQERVQYLFTLCRIDTIAIGCLLAVIMRSVDVERWRRRATLGALAVLPTVVVIAIASRLDRTSPFDRVFGYSVVAVGCVCVVALVVMSRGTRATAPLRFKPLTYLGKLCFGLYLLHRPADTIVTALGARLGIHHDLWLLVPKIAVAALLATISWRVLEQPFLRLKGRFATARHPNAEVVPAPAVVLPARPGFVTRALRMIGILLVLLVASCGEDHRQAADGGVVLGDSDTGIDIKPGDDAPIDAMVAPVRVLYPEGTRHSPITPDLVAHLKSIAVAGQRANVFAKVGDSITVTPDFLFCFDGGTVDLDGRTELAQTLAYFRGGNAAGTSPFARDSYAARSGTTAQDVLAGNPSGLDREITTIAPQVAVVMFGTNEARFSYSLEQFGGPLWDVIDDSIARGVVPVMSTIPPSNASSEADARVPLYNRVIRAIAQGRGVPLVDFHRELVSLPSRGISSDGIHPSVSPSGGCVLTPAGLRYGYNVRNLITLEALARTHAAITGTAADADAPLRGGTGSEADPYSGALPFVDIGDTTEGVAHVGHGCGSASGHEVAYRVTVPNARVLDVYVVDRGTTNVDVRILVNGACVGFGDLSASASVPAGNVDILVDARSTASEGEFLVVIESR